MLTTNFQYIISNDITAMVLDVLNKGVNPSIFNKIFIALIPKIHSPMTFKDLKPISLCNVVFKLITKVIANILESFLPKIIHET